MFEPTAANYLTLLRMLLVPVLVVFLLSELSFGEGLAAGVFIFASVTDIVDGYLARRNDEVTNFGKLMDPLADKLLVTAALVALVSLDRVQAWVAMVIIAREFAVTGMRQVAVEQGEVIAASTWGKIKTAFQILLVLVLILVDRDSVWVDLLAYVTVAVTVFSGAEYFFELRRLTTARA